MKKHSKIVVVGCGAVGSTFAYTVLVKGMVNELVLIDVNPDKAEGDALDLNHGILLAQPMKIKAGTYEDCKGADIIVIAAGANQKPGETRLDLMQRNVTIFREIIGEIIQYNQDGILLIATNPVDILTYVAQKISGWPKERVMGSGTLLDTARFRYLIAKKLDIDPRSIHGLIVGEHGDTEVPVWSLLNVAGTTQKELQHHSRLRLSEEDKETIYEDTRGAAYQIIQKKGSTYYAIALSLARICEAILQDQRSVLPVSTYLQGYLGIDDVCIGVPCIVGKNGAEEVLELPLSEDERQNLIKSADQLKRFLNQVSI
ncbi:L-lactate dehydrogenase [Microaerobacter geothermalis]|uniref:L-lactate dehydrogenase n=1 Tax=Microaerobacter geothermalis TaxID=674972 RepID=UPI001F01EED1|nr:L-lactate dehydrogenase [Microaerobacter geothermalis]MCF6094866.1 L-lactate dehydrogenase [Microaerobacter geothermalis]